ncbi:MAG: hypothetical protein ACRDQZ_13240 [Mycobacteriales bacterium]
MAAHPMRKRGAGISMKERVQWALHALLRAIDVLARSLDDRALVLAVVARRREYDDAVHAHEVASRNPVGRPRTQLKFPDRPHIQRDEPPHAQDCVRNDHDAGRDTPGDRAGE